MKSWDEKVNMKLAGEFKEWAAELPCLNSLRVPRWLLHKPDCEEMLIGFSDASMKGYGCCMSEL
jgi:hypothetical protein